MSIVKHDLMITKFCMQLQHTTIDRDFPKLGRKRTKIATSPAHNQLPVLFEYNGMRTLNLVASLAKVKGLLKEKKLETLIDPELQSNYIEDEDSLVETAKEQASSISNMITQSTK
ncbi:uncharacterized protein A4U43_C07F5510 [Asparagus officinalis]|uniref:Uncharacterized protein n=1 Tax=Asparagus officinalis TaxID=4686 RepID=A0A5P1E9P5_ASPOF|nr:uncharacterized protein A4U43_C07F5510 [Asparagus officinalis]